MDGWFLVIGLLASLVGYPVLIDVAPTGDALVSVSVVVDDAPTVLNISVIGEPYIYHAFDSDGNELPVNLTGDTLQVTVLENTTVTIEYVTALANKTGKVWTINITVNQPTRIILPENSATLYITPDPEYMTINGTRIQLDFNPGNILIEYTILTQPYTPSTTSPREQTEQTGNPQTETGAGDNKKNTLPVLVVAAGAGVATILYYIYRKNSGNPVYSDLDDRDKKILDAIRKNGGVATAPEIMAETGIPKTPLYRRLQKLVKYGLIEELPGKKKRYRIK